MMGLFLINPTYFLKRPLLLTFILFGLFVIAYVAMAWYDYYFDCQTLPLKRGTIGGVTKLFKPKIHSSKQLGGADSKDSNLELTELNKNRLLIYISHLIFIVPLVGYIAYYGKKTVPTAFALLGALAVFTALYHGVQLMNMSHKSV